MITINKIRKNRSAFTLVEIMIVVAIIGLFAALAIPGFRQSSCKQSQGRRILNDARQMDAAIDQWALETGQTDGNAINTTSASTYLKTAWKTTDLRQLLKSLSRQSVASPNEAINGSDEDGLCRVGIDWGPSPGLPDLAKRVSAFVDSREAGGRTPPASAAARSSGIKRNERTDGGGR